MDSVTFSIHQQVIFGTVLDVVDTSILVRFNHLGRTFTAWLSVSFVDTFVSVSTCFNWS